MNNPPLVELAYNIIGSNYAILFQQGSEAPSEEALARAAAAELIKICPALNKHFANSPLLRTPANAGGGFTGSGGYKKRKNRNRRTRRR
jgi:hypothetical protein